MLEKRGYTLVEMLIIVAIITIIVSMGVPGFLGMREKGARKICLGNLNRIKMAADQYRLDRNIPYNLNYRCNTDVGYVKLTDLWNNSGVKDLSQYISKKLTCPVRGNRYVGNLRWACSNGHIRIFVAVNGSMSHNETRQTGGPFCVVSGTRDIYKSSEGKEKAHYTQFIDSVDHFNMPAP